MNTLNIHEITSITVDANRKMGINKKSGNDMGHSRHLLIKNELGETFRITLFSDDKDALVIKSEV